MAKIIDIKRDVGNTYIVYTDLGENDIKNVLGVAHADRVAGHYQVELDPRWPQKETLDRLTKTAEAKANK